MLKQIWVKTLFEGFHRWKDAPDEVAFLREWHRHIFGVKVWFKVNHNDRDLEFFIMQRKIKEVLLDLYPYYTNLENDTSLRVWSCEMIAEDIYNYFEKEGVIVTRIVVDEDGENECDFITNFFKNDC